MTRSMIYPCILSGGSGTRLWPISRAKSPKQLQPLVSDNSLLVETAKRFVGRANFGAPIVICNDEYGPLVSTQLQDAGIDVEVVISEPFGRNTAPAAVAASLYLKDHDPNGYVLLLPADHFIQYPDRFCDKVLIACEAVKENYIVTFGIQPTHPDTGFGYIKRGAALQSIDNIFDVDEFVEKPDIATAKSYLDEKVYSWNSGMFLFRPDFFIDEIDRFRPDILQPSQRAFNAGHRRTKQDVKFLKLDEEIFRECPSDSIDYAVMEKTSRAAVIEVNIGWSDVGSWTALYEIGNKDEYGNVLRGDCLAIETDNSLIWSTNRLVTAFGMKNVVIAETADAVTICPVDGSQGVKKLHEVLLNLNRTEAIAHANHNIMSSDRETIKNWALNWLRGEVMPLWTSTGLNPDTSLAYEALGFDMKPITSLPTRLRVLPRQIYSIAFCNCVFGWEIGRAQMTAMAEFLDKNGRGRDGGWGHIFHPNGSLADRLSDCYDHAFVLLSTAWAYKTTSDETYKRMAYDTYSYLQTALKHEKHGYLENNQKSRPRRANPHMHLLEAALCWFDLHQELPFGDLAHEIVELYTNKFTYDGLVREFFDDALNIDTSTEALAAVEPGHLYEWAFLLKEYERVTGRDAPNTAPMIAFANAFGWNEETGLIMDRCLPDGGRVGQVTSRLWPQTEYIRFCFRYGTDQDKHKALNHLQHVVDCYFTFDGKTPGIWRDMLDETGADLSKNVPASSLYHIVGMIAVL